MAGRKAANLGEYDERLAVMHANMEAHIKADAVAFAALIEQLKEVNQDVKSIITTRAYAAGLWKMASIIGGATIAVAGLVIAAIKLLG